MGVTFLLILKLLAGTSATHHHQAANKTGICRKRAETRFILSHQSTLGGIGLLRRAIFDRGDILLILQLFAAALAKLPIITPPIETGICRKRAEIRFIL
jgi:hypothetical protein